AGETVLLQHVRRSVELPVETVRPCMVGTRDRIRAAGGLIQEARPPVAADVREGSDRAVLVPDHDDALARERLDEVFAGARHLLLPADAEPVPGEDAFLLELPDILG